MQITIIDKQTKEIIAFETEVEMITYDKASDRMKVDGVILNHASDYEVTIEL